MMDVEFPRLNTLKLFPPLSSEPTMNPRRKIPGSARAHSELERLSRFGPSELAFSVARGVDGNR